MLHPTEDNIMAKRSVTNVTLASIMPMVKYITTSSTERTRQVREPRLVRPHLGAEHPHDIIRAMCWALACVQDCFVYTTQKGTETQPGVQASSIRHLFGDGGVDGDRWYDRFLVAQGADVVLRTQPLYGKRGADGERAKATGSIVKFADQISDNGRELADIIRKMAADIAR